MQFVKCTDTAKSTLKTVQTAKPGDTIKLLKVNLLQV